MQPLTPPPLSSTSSGRASGLPNRGRDRMLAVVRAWLPRQRPRLWWKVLLAGAVAWVIVTRLATHLADGQLVAGALLMLGFLLGGALIPCCFLLYWYEECREAPMSPRIVRRALITSVAVGLAMVVLGDHVLSPATTWHALVAISIVQEAAMVLAILLIARAAAHHLTHPLHGLLVGVTVGTGFAIAELLGHGLHTVVLGIQLGNVALAFSFAHSWLLTQVVFSPCGSIAWAGILGAVLWRAWRPRQQAHPGQPIHSNPGARIGRALDVVEAGLAVLALSMLWDTSLSGGWPSGNSGFLGWPLVGLLIIGALGPLFLIFFIVEARATTSQSQPLPPLALAVWGYFGDLAAFVGLAQVVVRWKAWRPSLLRRTTAPPLWGPPLPPSPDDPTSSLAPTEPLPVSTASSSTTMQPPTTTPILSMPVQPALEVHATPAQGTRPGTDVSCQHCGTRNRAAAHYCVGCGRGLPVLSQP